MRTQAEWIKSIKVGEYVALHRPGAMRDNFESVCVVKVTKIGGGQVTIENSVGNEVKFNKYGSLVGGTGYWIPSICELTPEIVDKIALNRAISKTEDALQLASKSLKSRNLEELNALINLINSWNIK